MKPLYPLLAGLLLAGCQALPEAGPDSYRYRLPAGTQLVLHRELDIPAQRAHVVLQHGRVLTAASRFDVACHFRVRDLGPRVIRPDAFLVTGYSSQREWENRPHTMRYYRTIRLQAEHQPGILPMVCEYYDWPVRGNPVTLPEIEEALGDYFSFRIPG